MENNYEIFCSEILEKSEKAAKIAAKKKWSYLFGIAAFIIIAITVFFINAHSNMNQNVLIFFVVFYIIVVTIFWIFFPVGLNKEDLNRAYKKIVKEEVDNLNDAEKYKRVIITDLENRLTQERKDANAIRDRLFFFGEVPRDAEDKHFDSEIDYLKRNAN